MAWERWERGRVWVGKGGRRTYYGEGAGKLVSTRRRPSSHFEKWWFPSVRRVDVYATRGTRSLPAMECVATHRFQPTRNKFKLAERKWTPKCPLREINKEIRRELRSIFRFA